MPLITLNILSTMDVIVRQHFQRKLLVLAKFNHALAKLVVLIIKAKLFCGC